MLSFSQIYSFIKTMGFFDSIVEDSTKTTATSNAVATQTVPTPEVAAVVTSDPLSFSSSDTAISFDSADLVILDDTPTIKVDSVTAIPDTVGEMFQAPASSETAIEAVLEELPAAPEADGLMILDTAPEATFESPIFDTTPPEATTTPPEATTTSLETTTVDIPEVSALGLETPTIEASLAEVSTVEATSANIFSGEDFSVSAFSSQVEDTVQTEEVVDADTTLKEAIAKLEANAKTIQTKADAAFADEARLLEEKSRKEAEHKVEMKKLTQAALEARKSGEEITKSGERTNELIKLLGSQIAV